MIVEKQTEYGYISYYENDQVFADGLRNGKIYEQGLILSRLADYVKDSKVIFDIGAHTGSHTVMYKYLNPKCLIWAFEPQKKMFELLQHNINKNKLGSVLAFNKAMGHKRMNFTMSNMTTDGENMRRPIDYGTKQRFNLGGLQVGTGGEEIEIWTVDEMRTPSIDYMKIDVEGFEFLVILGGMETIKRDRPIIVFENNHKVISKPVLSRLGVNQRLSVESMLNNLDYKVSLLDDQGNFLAIPS